MIEAVNFRFPHFVRHASFFANFETPNSCGALTQKLRSKKQSMLSRIGIFSVIFPDERCFGENSRCSDQRRRCPRA
jgi:hypothetical protein